MPREPDEVLISASIWPVTTDAASDGSASATSADCFATVSGEATRPYVMIAAIIAGNSDRNA